jgi:hypothetical protein
MKATLHTYLAKHLQSSTKLIYILFFSPFNKHLFLLQSISYQLLMPLTGNTKQFFCDHLKFR